MQMGSKFPEGEGGCTRAAPRRKFPPGRASGWMRRVWSCCRGGQEREQGRERGLAGAIAGSKFPGSGEPARLHASKFLVGEGAWGGGEGGVHVYRRGEGGADFLRGG